MATPNILSQLIASLPELTQFHAPSNGVYQLLKTVAAQEVRAAFAGTTATPQSIDPFGHLLFPYTRMGAIDSLDLFGLDELIIFAFYARNRGRYRKTLDMGANIGLHSLIMARCGFEVRSFEPDPHHYTLLNRNLQANDVHTVTPVQAAVSTENGTMEFVRVLGNTTGSHLAGAKPHVYGELERFPVQVLAFDELVRDADFVKLDVEGHEKHILTHTTAQQWAHLDMMAEIGSADNAHAVFEHLRSLGVHMFAQKIRWQEVRSLQDMPTSYKDGSLFLSTQTTMPW